MCMGDKKYSFVEINKKRHGTPVLFSVGIQGTLKYKRTNRLTAQCGKKKNKNTHTKSGLSLISVNHSLKGALKLNKFLP